MKVMTMEVGPSKADEVVSWISVAFVGGVKEQEEARMTISFHWSKWVDGIATVGGKKINEGKTDMLIWHPENKRVYMW
jgi:hypothetical protein